MELYIVDEREGVVQAPEVEESWQLMLEQLALVCLEEAGHPLEDTEISLVLTNDEKIRRLNADYRNIDQPTDVLSFAMEEQADDEPDFDDPTAGMVLGDIIISVETAERQAAEYGHTLEREMGFLFVHGMLHLLGYDHGDEEETKRMRAMEEKVLQSQGLQREWT
ncbi:rRNA maturation RNase YbeY [Heliobacterium gestii]|uniref:Endoribonuclease YbeY n=1 Tax=Heliomicrobium gestii TaxID=2699 RepID=A0A845LFC2_HELGE|nr:rRNA maturation RNase YbeY [Heliomicrobium gestii]MBM7867995.1 putative rRNA maturation factor [Heliomicrobium gestii]MZP44261.1 rRNA maturation RNase YbeY [Heliomicrobium gestii]